MGWKIVDSDALAKALGEGKLLGAGLDVLTGEPQIKADHPLVKEKKCVVLPHIGSATVRYLPHCFVSMPIDRNVQIDTRELMSEQAVHNLLAGLAGTEMVSENRL